MNNARRKAIKNVQKKLEALGELQAAIKEELESILDEEQDALDNMPESLQEGERGQQMQEYIDQMYDAIDTLDELDVLNVIDQLEEIL